MKPLEEGERWVGIEMRRWWSGCQAVNSKVEIEGGGTPRSWRRACEKMVGGGRLLMRAALEGQGLATQPRDPDKKKHAVGDSSRRKWLDELTRSPGWGL